MRIARNCSGISISAAIAKYASAFSVAAGTASKVGGGEAAATSRRMCLTGVGEADELEVVEAPLGKLVVEATHLVPRAVAHAHEHDGQRERGRAHDGLDRLVLLRHLAIGDDEEDVIGLGLPHDLDCNVDDGSEIGRARQLDPRSYLLVSIEYLLETMTWPIGIEGEARFVSCVNISKAKCRDQMVVIESLQSPPDYTQHVLIWVGKS